MASEENVWNMGARLAEIAQLKAEIERLRSERDALESERNAALAAWNKAIAGEAFQKAAYDKVKEIADKLVQERAHLLAVAKVAYRINDAWSRHTEDYQAEVELNANLDALPPALAKEVKDE